MLHTLQRRIYSLLRRSERFTRTDMVYLAKNGSWMVGAHVVSTVLGLGLTIAFANLVTPEVYGQYKYVISVAAIIGALVLGKDIWRIS